MKVRLLLYKVLTLGWFLLLIAAMFFLTDGSVRWALAAFVGAILVVFMQALLILCPYCHARPGVWILAIWTVLFDLELYVADVLFLRACPRCKRQLAAPVGNVESTT
jgi:hypothetical protein